MAQKAKPLSRPDRPPASPASGRRAGTGEEHAGALLEELLVETSRTFALSIPLLPEPTCREVTIAYLIFRIADTFEDSHLWSPERRIAALAEVARILKEPSPQQADRLARSWCGDPPCEHAGYQRLLRETPEVLGALLELSPAARSIVVEHSVRTADRMASFVARSRTDRSLRLRDTADLKAYCYAVAGIVGEMLTELYLSDWPALAPVGGYLKERAADFGEGLQLVNILKDSARDGREGRHYIPRQGSREEVLALARRDLDRAAEYVLALHRAEAPRGLIAFNALPLLLARPTLDRVEEKGPGAKLTRPQVFQIYQRLHEALEAGQPPV